MAADTSKASEAVYRVPEKLMRWIWNVVAFYQNEHSYLGERTGGVLAGCPRTADPEPNDLAREARMLMRALEEFVRPTGSNIEWRPICTMCQQQISEQEDVPEPPSAAANVSASGEVPTIDLTYAGWDAIKKAASESPWIPPEYFQNDWVADVCAFLREPASDDRLARVRQLALGWDLMGRQGDDEIGEMYADLSAELLAIMESPTPAPASGGESVTKAMVKAALVRFLGHDPWEGACSDPAAAFDNMHAALEAAERARANTRAGVETIESLSLDKAIGDAKGAG